MQTLFVNSSIGMQLPVNGEIVTEFVPNITFSKLDMSSRNQNKIIYSYPTWSMTMALTYLEDFRGRH